MAAERHPGRVGRAIVALSLLAVSGFPAPALAEAVLIDGVELDVFPPQGMCALSRSREPDRREVETLERTLANASTPLLLFADCAELEAWRLAPGSPFTEYGYLFVTKDVLEGNIRAGLEQTLDIAEAYLGSQSPGDREALAEVGMERARVERPGLEPGDVSFAGDWIRDKNGVYSQQTVTYAVKGEVLSFRGVTTSTALSRLPVAFGLYSGRAERDGSALLTLAQAYAGSLTSANPSAGGELRVGLWLTHTIGYGLGMAALPALILGFFWVRRKRRAASGIR